MSTSSSLQEEGNHNNHHKKKQLKQRPPPPVRLVWHRRDLRLHDNFLYSVNDNDDDDDDTNINNNIRPQSSSSSPVTIISLFIFDMNDFNRRPSICRPNDDWDAINVGPHSIRILLDSLHDLRHKLRSIGGELIIRKGCPTKIIPQILIDINATEIYWNEEPGLYEQQQSYKVWKSIRNQLCCYPQPSTVKICTSMQYTLYHPDDLPYGKMEWDQLAHPNQKTSKKKRQKQQKKCRGDGTTEKSSNIPPTSRRQDDDDDDGRMVNIDIERWDGICKIMGDFRKAARSKTKPRICLPTPKQLFIPDTIRESFKDVGSIPSLKELCQPLLLANDIPRRPILGQSNTMIQTIINNAIENERIASTSTSDDDDDEYDDSSDDKNNHDNNKPCSSIVRGGETSALKHLEKFVSNHAATAKRNLADVVSNNDSSRISHYLCWGCLSPRKVIEQVENNTDHGNSNGNNCDWLISHMTMRDFFLYTCIATGSKFYSLDGIPLKRRSNIVKWKNFDDELTMKKFELWATGKTGFPLIDAAMREMISTGYCSNRVRQNLCSFLTKDLQVDWRAGAEWFQLVLDDHCVGANWGNWLYFSGVGPDPKQRHFKTISQALKYDPNGKYVQKWIPELSLSSSYSKLGDKKGIEKEEEYYLRPWDFFDNQDWRTIIDPKTQYTWKDLKQLEENGKLLIAVEKY